jgi:triosephosphate isomerase
MTFLVVATFKSNKTAAEVSTWLKSVKPNPHIAVAPSFPHLHLFKDKGLTLAAQDVSPFPPGSYTGAVSAVQLKEQGVTYCLVGHSERRRYFHETPSDVASKIRELVAVGITPILCLDELDITPQFASLDEEFYAKCLYCYEPASGIGGTTTADPQVIKNVRHRIYDHVPNAPFMYGGSVTKDNVAALLPLNLAGLLVASASLDPAHYLSIVDKVTHGA